MPFRTNSAARDRALSVSCGVAIFLALGNLLSSKPSFAQEIKKSKPDQLLSEGESLVKQRHILIDDYVTWANEAAGLAKEGKTPETSEFSPLLDLWSLMFELKRLRSDEAADLALDQFHVTVRHPVSRRVRRPAADVLTALGRQASARIIERLGSSQQLPSYFMDTLRKIEGPAVEALLKHPPRYAPFDVAAPKRTEGSLEVRFAQIPSIRTPEYAGHDTKSVFDLSESKITEGPIVSAESLQGPRDKLFTTLLGAVRESGDFALLDSSVLVPSGRYARLGTGSFQELDGRDLSSLVRKGDPVVRRVLKREILLIETKEKGFGLIQFLGMNKDEGEPIFCYLYKPDGSAIFKMAPLPSPFEIEAGRPALKKGQKVAYSKLVINRARSFFRNYQRIARDLSALADDRMPFDVTSSQRAQALRLLGKLRHVESASVMIHNLNKEFPNVSELSAHPSVEAMRHIWPVPRLALLSEIGKAEEARRRKLLVDVLNEIEGAAVANELLKKP